MKSLSTGVKTDTSRKSVFNRIHKYATCSNECFILALIYIDRLIQRNNFLLTELNVHRVVITAVLLAAKFFDDAYYNNAYYAKVGGVLVSEMNGLEVDFLFRVNFSLHVTPDLFQKYREELLSHTNMHEMVPAPLLPVAVASIPMNGSVYVNVDAEPRPSSANQHHHYERHGNYITPSPPPESARAMPANHISSDVSGLDNPYLQPVCTMPQYNAHRRCSPQPMYPHNTSNDPCLQTGNNLTFPIHHGAMVHHNHAKVDHGFHNPQRHSDPLYSDSGHHQYFISGSHMLTGCPGGS